METINTKFVSKEVFVDEPGQIMERLAPYFAVPPDRVRDRIVTNARSRFLTEGFAKITIEDLCHGMKISKKTFYKHFRDKDDLVHAVVALNMREIVPAVTAALADDAPADVRLDRMMNTALNVVARRITTVFLADLQAVIPELWEAIDTFRRNFVLPRITGLIEEGQGTGRYRDDIDPKTVSRFLLLVLTRIADPRVLYENDLAIEPLFRTIFTVLRYGMERRDGGTRPEEIRS